MSSALDERILSLEKQVHAQRCAVRILACSLVCVIGVAFFAGAAALTNQPGDTITARKLIIQDADGKARISLDAPNIDDGTGDARLLFFGKDGQAIAAMGQYDNGQKDGLAWIWLQRYSGKSSVYLSSASDYADLSAAGTGGIRPVEVVAFQDHSSISIIDPVATAATIALSMNGASPSIVATDKNGGEVFAAKGPSAVAGATASSIEITVENGVPVVKKKP